MLVTARRFVEMGVVGAGEREPPARRRSTPSTRPLQAPELVGVEDAGPTPAPSTGPPCHAVARPRLTPGRRGARPRGRHYRARDAPSQPPTPPPARARPRAVGPVGIAATVTLVLVAGSLLAIHTQSQGYRDATTRGYVALADQVGQASTRTGAQLSRADGGAAPTLPDQRFPATARGVLQQGLDAAVLDTADPGDPGRHHRLAAARRATWRHGSPR